ncbi:tRNA pseudouridine(38-40) synthase TruA [Candidatus Fukatsuia symbiotica]|uniref:tRNA pseudouridine synthase A n=1 Tax=Candidatus Fukatsuia symbiotica TaxID=1878942 RepID=A0A2U8I3Y4_9GAMM|nr:tRNA pseudouridine(38-40) synthase TruA [Candidatus Fukatsuia symbiotica]AWK13828.1 tRNA pseudouridine(38-40) synthase TruA [Candidatus Fukatsuia symbiotica]MEA9446030.1 tRNA pseudouridine(38-40) synthase TruA [Candidatus Fukatsuia symbiotica]
MSKHYNIALGIEYNGNGYHGWQRQKQSASIQGCLEAALSKIADQSINVFCAGRTDAGVHATGQVVHFVTTTSREESAWTIGTNTHLPADITVRWMKTVTEDFHARFSANARRYHYIIFNHRYRPAILAHGVTHYPKSLDAQKMARAAQYLLGEHDFTSFRALQCQAKTARREVKHVIVSRYGDYIMIDIKANAFLHHMVRNIVGSLIEIGVGHKNENWLAQLLMLKDRTQAAATAKANGLYLVGVDYPTRFALPQSTSVPFFYG